MNNLSSLLFHFTTILFLGLTSSCSWATDRTDKIHLVGSTPGDELIKTQLDLPKETIIDFIQWDLTFINQNTFELKIVYGESQPNTLGFKQGGQNKSYQGEYHISKDNGNEIYQLKCSEFQTEISLIKLNANIFHLLTPQKKLMVGNGGWSYSLNSKTPDTIKYPLPTLTNSTSILKDTALQVIYDGRTPCQEFAAEHQINVSKSCFKLKWKLTLNRDSVTYSPTTYTIRKVVDNIPRDVTGNWTITKGTSSNPDVIVIQLDPDKPNQTISLFVGDDNVLFFLHKDKNLFIGNDNFSFTLNKRHN